jgi:hypothetical protein
VEPLAGLGDMGQLGRVGGVVGQPQQGCSLSVLKLPFSLWVALQGSELMIPGGDRGLSSCWLGDGHLAAMGRPQPVLWEE